MSGAYDPLAQRAAETDSQPANANTYDPLALVAAGKPLPAANDSTPASSTPKWESDWLAHGNPVNQFVQGAFDRAITSTGGAIAGGLKGLWDLAAGRPSSEAAADVGNIERESTYAPDTTAQRAGAEAASSNWNPLNWPGVVIGKTGELLGEGAERLGAPPIVSTLAQVAPAAAVSALGLRAAGIEPGEGYVPEAERVAAAPAPAAAATPTASPATLSASGTPRAAPWMAAEGEATRSAATPGAAGAAPAAPAADGPPVEGGLPKEVQAARQAILQRVGIGQARKSAVQGDAQAAATDYQATRFDEPAGRAMAAQFDHEREALAGFTQGLITKIGGSIGMDEDALINRGTTITKPFDDLRAWFGQRQKQLYAQAQARSDELAANGNPTAYTQLQGVDELLKSPDFRNTLMARDQGNLLNAAQAQLQRFRETNPAGFTPAGAEQFRQWLNQVWSPDNRWAVGKLKDAIDNDVISTAGEDLYAQARAIRALKARTLEDPKGIAQLFDANPMTPINRVTPFERIPDKIMALPAEQFGNLVQTLKQMPPELQPVAQAALGEIKGQLLNRLLKAGTETRSGRGAQLWRGEDVSQAIGRHAAKFRIAFDGDPQMQAAIKDLNSAGQILRADQSYPGAYAQAANMSKRGIGSSVVRHLGRVGGAMVGGVAGPFGAAGGEMAGGAAGEAAASALSERAALKTMRQRIIDLEGR